MTVPFTRFFIRYFLALGLLLAALPAVAQTRTIVVLGDSLSAAYNMAVERGWVALLEQRLRQQSLPYKVINASISGDTTAGGRARLPKLLAEHRPAVVVIELGGNDGLRGLPPEEAKRNLLAMVSQSQAAGAKVLLLGVELPPNYGTRYNERFRRIYGEVAAARQVPLVPFVLDGVATEAALMQSDGIHPNAAAQPRILDNVWPRLRPLLAAAHPEPHNVQR